MLRLIPVLFLAAQLTISAPAQAAETPPAAPKARGKTPTQPTPAPTHRNVVYGPHARNVLDLWIAPSDKPTPVLVHIHGGGWINGDKTSLSAPLLKKMLENGISVASVNYRYSTMEPLPAPVHDAARAIQFLRSRAAEWNLRKDRFAAIGGSAGACSSLWLAYHDDLAQPTSTDPVLRESTRLVAAVGLSGQTAIDPKMIVPWVGEQVMNHAMISRAVGAKDGADAMANYEKHRALYQEFSAYNHVSKNDPPTLLIYPKLVPVPAENPGDAIHHAAFGKQLKEKADKAGTEVVLQIGRTAGANATTPEDFLLKHLLQ
jgi:arylformamidase